MIELYDALLSGNDLEITPWLSLKRRPGYLSYALGTLNGALLWMYSWRSASKGVFQIFNTSVDLEYIAPGATVATVIQANGLFGTNFNRAGIYGVGNYLFATNPRYRIKWDGGSPQGTTQWGVSIGTQVSGGSYGPQTAGAGANYSNGSLQPWLNPGYVSSAVNYATVTASMGFPSPEYLEATQFGFAVPLTGIGKIVGVEVTVQAELTSITGSSTTAELNAILCLNGAPFSSSRLVFSTTTTATATTYTVGGASDLWGSGSLTAANVNSATFGVMFAPSAGGAGAFTAAFGVNDVQITVFYAGSFSASVNGSGTFSAQNGYSYVYAYGNGVSTEISNASAVSNNTGPFTGAQNVELNLTASTDTQVNQIHVYRTTDSGGGSIFYELPNSPFPNVTGNVFDNALDINLQIANQAATQLQNSVPPVGMSYLEWFAGRLWGALDNLLYFSTGPDTIVGLEQSNWDPEYVFVLPTTISRMVATPNGMLVFCLDDCYIVRGISTVTFTVNEFMRDVGCRSAGAVDTDGSNVYVFTSDRQLLQIGGNGTSDIGQSIGDQLLNVDPTKAVVTIYRYGLDSMLFLFDTVNGVLYPFNVPQQCWCLPAILQFNFDGINTSAGAMETAPGVWKYLIAAGVNLAQRDLNTFSDLGNPYEPVALIGAITLADPLSLAKVENIIMQLTSAGNVPELSVLPNDAGATLTNAVGEQVTGNFTSLSVGNNPITEPPTYASQATAFRNYRYQWALCPLPAQIQFIQFLLEWGNEEAANELIGFGISGKNSGDSPQQGQIPELMGH